MRGASADPLAGRAARAAFRRSPRALRRKHAAGCTSRTGRSAPNRPGAKRRPRQRVRVRWRGSSRHSTRACTPPPALPRRRRAGGASCRFRPGPRERRSARRPREPPAAPSVPRRFSQGKNYPASGAEAGRARARVVASIHAAPGGRRAFQLKFGGENTSLYLQPPVLTSKKPTTYRDAGVDIDAGDALVEAIKPFAKRTLRPEVLAGIGGFGALAEIPKKYRRPVLVSGTDGVGTKLKLAFELQRHDTVGIDLVAMSVNDILVCGAEPLFFLDYYVCEKLDVRVATEVVKGIAAGCELAGCALIGGEPAEHPNAFPKDEYDLAGFALGVVEKDRIVDGRSIRPGDVILGLASSGPHSNCYSLIRKILERAAPPQGFDLLEPTRIYVKPVLKLLESVRVKGLAHITGGGLIGNVPRILPEKTKAVIDKAAWPRPTVFQWLQREGNIAEGEMHRAFNCGIGMVLVAAAAHASRAAALLRAAGETVYEIGVIEKAPGAPQAIIVQLEPR